MPMSDAEIAKRLTRIAAFERKRMANDAGACRWIARMGRELAALKAARKRDWKRWADEHLPFDYKTATRYIDVWQKETILSPFFPLGKSAVYALAEIAGKTPAKLKGLSWKSTVNGCRLANLDCHDIAVAFGDAPAPATPRRPDPRDCVKMLLMIKREHPELWGEVVDDIVALLADGAAPAPAKPSGTLSGRTRDERAQELVGRAQELLDAVDDVDDVAGRLAPALKLKLMQLALVIWREVNRLPAVAHLPAGWKPSQGVIQGMVLRPRP